MQRTYITELEAAVADSFQKYASDKKKCDKAMEGARNRCIQKGADPSTAVTAFFGGLQEGLGCSGGIADEESKNRKV